MSQFEELFFEAVSWVKGYYLLVGFNPRIRSSHSEVKIALRWMQRIGECRSDRFERRSLRVLSVSAERDGMKGCFSMAEFRKERIKRDRSIDRSPKRSLLKPSVSRNKRYQQHLLSKAMEGRVA